MDRYNFYAMAVTIGFGALITGILFLASRFPKIVLPLLLPLVLAICTMPTAHLLRKYAQEPPAHD